MGGTTKGTTIGVGHTELLGQDEYEEWGDLRDFESRIWAITNRLHKLMRTTPRDAAPALLQTLLESMVASKETLTNTKAEILASDLRQRIEADQQSQAACQKLTDRLMDLTQDLLVYNTEPRHIDCEGMTLLKKYNCGGWADLDNVIRRLEAEAHVIEHANSTNGYRMAAGLDFQLLSNSDPTPRASPSQHPTTESRYQQPYSTPTIMPQQPAPSQALATHMVGPDIIPFDGKGRRTFDQFVRDFGWRYGHFSEHTQRSCFVNFLRGYALDVFDSLEPEVQNGPLGAIFNEMKARLAARDQVPLTTLYSQLVRCKRDQGQSITEYIVKLDLLAGQLYQPTNEYEKEYIEIGKANALLEHTHEPDLAIELGKVITTTSPRDVFKEARDCALRFERLRLSRNTTQPTQQQQNHFPKRSFDNHQQRPPARPSSGRPGTHAITTNDTPNQNTEISVNEDPSLATHTLAITPQHRGPTHPDPEEDSVGSEPRYDIDTGLADPRIRPNADPGPVHDTNQVSTDSFGCESAWLNRDKGFSTLGAICNNLFGDPLDRPHNSPRTQPLGTTASRRGG
ncbi:hypothetical protein AAVH_13997 [Aphelenchoides avenae]|nr:hypothetical protein AAVH_13997 [Aphelenchus avenae]